MTAKVVEDLLGPDPAATGHLRHHHGVSTTWLSKVFRMDKTTVKMRLAECPPLTRIGPYPVYDIAQAAAYLIPPRVDIAEWITSLDPSELPPHLASEFWGAKLKRQKWERDAADLWRRADVLDVFSAVFGRVNEGVQLWLKNLETIDVLTDGHKRLTGEMADGLLDDLRERLLEAPARRQVQEDPAAAPAPGNGSAAA